ncbi:hypothetical protein CLAFUW4_12886 [Fulvia fulva]|uniref:Uncharacterized protein n=1 Tax=Passalora fulva TaxID=5499 RepID=A0A9Q8UVK2_PASFU|nr:uncharacterized protein CLAFUR5_12752 [Fulvia fulva]KAK4612241.1 hypothetical protein CLAFUR4_12890 [Fulvia fulva]KAK4613146.1 hypothetical protein CLAFUR0_12896 [Fulvia fulva]UJO23967.1 hypothetical protein CLAFUR5_12752 [Fulvia fulva]WPV21414.1 hypothetical protein CLAFUW4_12886 [Fulvia fulva]WPV36523.1 hypothetical protein CLAFUW7_12893 [Fulvia fulva]
MDSDWTASALFSPSKARVQQAQAKDWAAVDAWLLKRYGSRMPTFERNEDTLQALLTLANLNENADEQRTQIERIEKTALQSLSKRQGGISDEVLQAMQVELVNETHLDTLAETMVALDCPNTDATTMGSAMIQLASTDFEMKQQLERTQAQLGRLKDEQARATKILEELKGNEFQPPEDIVTNTAEWTKTAKHLKAKVAEYEERIAASRPSSSGNSFATFSQKAAEVASQREQFLRLESEMSAFKGLPADSRAARRKVEEGREQLRQLTMKRDRLFEGMVEQ